MTLRGPATLNEERSAVFTVDLGAEVTGSTPVTVAITTGGTATENADYTLDPASKSLTIAAGARSATFTVAATDGGGDDTEDRTLTLTVTATGGANTAATASTSRTVTISEDDPAAREARLEAPLASAGRGIGQLAAAAVVGRMAVGGGGGGAGNSLTLAGRNITGMETLAAHYLADGYATGAADLSAEELLRTSGFNLAGGSGGRGFNFWGQGEFVSAEGDHDGVDYDGDTSAFHLGIETDWKGGLVGVSVGRSAGDVDFTVKADGMKSTLETEVTSVHPYLTRRLNRAQLWLTAGHGFGDAEVKEPDVTIKTDVTVTTAAFGANFTLSDSVMLGAHGIFTRAELDAAHSGGKTLPAVTVDAFRVNATAEYEWDLGAWRPFGTAALRHDGGDGDSGVAGDLGGGVEWRGPAVNLRLEGSKSLAGGGADESRLGFTARKTAGRLNLGINLTANAGLNTANLLTGELRF